MEEKENFSQKGNKVIWKGPKLGIVIVVGVILLILLGMQVYAGTNGYGNLFFMIKELVNKKELSGEDEVFYDKEITLSYKSIDIADGIKIQVNKIEVLQNESKIYVTVKNNKENNELLPLNYSVSAVQNIDNGDESHSTRVPLGNDESSDLEIKGKNTVDTEYADELEMPCKVDNSFSITIDICDKNKNKLKQIIIDLSTREITVIGEEPAKQISEIELKKYLNLFSELNNDSSEIDKLIKISYIILTMNNPDRLDAPGIEEINQVVKEVYGDKVAFEKVKDEDGNNVEVLKRDNNSKFSYSLKSNVYSIENDDRDGLCLKINDISYEEGIYTVKYIYTIATPTDIADEKVEELPQYEATIKLKRNEDAKYSKYQLIELSKGTKVKEKVQVKIDEKIDNDEMKVTKEGVAGNYIYYEAKDENGKDVGYREIFGSSFSMNPGKLSLKDDGTFEGYLPGVSDKVYATKGTFEIDGNNIILKYSDSRKETLEFVNAQDYEYIRIKQKYAGYTLILKLNDNENKSEIYDNHDHNYEVIKNSGTKAEDGTHTTLDGEHDLKCSICGDTTRKERHNFGKWFELKDSTGKVYAYTLWCEDCKDYVYTDDYNVVQNSGYGLVETDESDNNKLNVNGSYRYEEQTDNFYHSSNIIITNQTDTSISFSINTAHGNDVDHVNIGEVSGIANKVDIPTDSIIPEAKQIAYQYTENIDGNINKITLICTAHRQFQYIEVKEDYPSGMNPYAGNRVYFSGEYEKIN